MAKVRASGVWDEMSGSGLTLMLHLMQEQFGFPLDRLDRLTAIIEPVFENGSVIGNRQVVTIEGNDDLGEPVEHFGSQYRAERIGDYTVLHSQWNEGESVVSVTPRLRVYGPTELVTAVLQGRPRAGLPSSDVMSFTAGQQGLLVHFVCDLRHDDQPRRALHQVLPDADWPDDDQPTLFGGRVLVTGDEDDPHLTLEVVIRHGADGQGLVATEAAAAACLERLGKMTEARLFRPLLKRVVHERDGTDAVWRLDIGRARAAGGVLGTLLPLLAVAQTAEAQAPLVPVEVVAEEAEPAPPAPEQPGPKNNGGR